MFTFSKDNFPPQSAADVYIHREIAMRVLPSGSPFGYALSPSAAAQLFVESARVTATERDVDMTGVYSSLLEVSYEVGIRVLSNNIGLDSSFPGKFDDETRGLTEIYYDANMEVAHE